MAQLKIKDIYNHLHSIAPFQLQESYDNSGLLVGNMQQEIKGVLLSLDCTEAVIEDALSQGCNLVVCHHPVIFSGLKRLNGNNYVERTIISAIKNDIAILAIHTNLDNVLNQGVSNKMAEKLGLINVKTLSPKKGLLQKLKFFVPEGAAEQVKTAVFNAGAGEIGDYNECSYSWKGEGTFKANDRANPYIGKKGERHSESEIAIEVLVEKWKMKKIISRMLEAHPYEEVAYDIHSIENSHNYVGSGVVGDIDIESDKLLQKIKDNFGGVVRYTNLHKKRVKKVALCGGSGSFLLNEAKASGADLFLTADYKYHQFFDAENEIIIADIGHFESEQFTIELLSEIITEKFPNFAVRFTKVKTNPINYL
jgi:dinuclear metal center YbgI/SA1388 family protein